MRSLAVHALVPVAAALALGSTFAATPSASERSEIRIVASGAGLDGDSAWGGRRPTTGDGDSGWGGYVAAHGTGV
ncbi:MULTISPECIES: hypothetical protein [Streptomyces]|jgi:hypothetical protein|uniref:Uncharacterized protein n=1 Tax=Streptomyces eurythermus TaxID=42237 RepID=A0ABW6YQJ4_9ACTN|nr:MULTISPECIES: hypothetical protein [Streptomyces]QIS74356.1 hypothetical protein HB370_33855 [Streptomyces sp. DSM 40868]WDM15093.1 hypothetical protein J3S85_28415 [Streptomyces lavenduligriseus]